jgi:uncharacterized protein (DUF2147 family)
MAFTAAALFSTQLLAVARDPIGVWLKEDGTAKMEIRKCGRNQLCSRIVWLKDPNDSRGKPLRDARNERTSLRGRQIVGLPIFQGLTPAGKASWTGSIYNPEDGNTYKATLTLVSSRQIVLKGCKAFGILCGQKVWTRSKLDSTPPQIEASAEPEKPKIQTASAVPEPTPKPVVKPAPAPTAQADPEPKPEMSEANAAPLMEPKATSGLPAVQPVAQRRVLQPEVPHPSHDAREGFGFVTTSAIPDPAPLFTSERPSTMFAMTSPVAYALAPAQTLADEAVGDAVGDAEAQPETEAAAAVPLPDHKPKVVPKPRPRVSAQKQKQKEEWLPPWLR